jgi:hypothetical protein
MPDPLLSYNVWYRELGRDDESRQRRWREFLLDNDPNEEVVRRAEAVLGTDAYRRRLEVPQARSLPRIRGRPCKPPPGRGGVFSTIL